MNTYNHDLLLQLQTNFIFTKKIKGFLKKIKIKNKIKWGARKLTQNTLKIIIYKYITLIS